MDKAFRDARLPDGLERRRIINFVPKQEEISSFYSPQKDRFTKPLGCSLPLTRQCYI